jgi:hypothetical protein
LFVPGFDAGSSLFWGWGGRALSFRLGVEGRQETTSPVDETLGKRFVKVEIPFGDRRSKRSTGLVLPGQPRPDEHLRLLLGDPFEGLDTIVAVRRREDLYVQLLCRFENHAPQVRLDAVMETILDFVDQQNAVRRPNETNRQRKHPVHPLPQIPKRLRSAGAYQ